MTDARNRVAAWGRGNIVAVACCAVFGGIAARYIFVHLKRVTYSKIFQLIFLILFVFSGVYTLYSSHPFESSYFNAFVGGTEGVTEKNIVTVTYWQDELLYALDQLNTLPKNASIGSHPFHAPLLWYQKQGLLRSDLKITDDNPDYVAVSYRQETVLAMPPNLGCMWNPYSFYESTFSVRDHNDITLLRAYNMSALRFPNNCIYLSANSRFGILCKADDFEEFLRSVCSTS